MNAIRLPSGDHEARSPKCVNCLMLGGSCSSGLPVFVPCGAHVVTASASVRATHERMRRIPTDLGGTVKFAGNGGEGRSGVHHEETKLTKTNEGSSADAGLWPASRGPSSALRSQRTLREGFSVRLSPSPPLPPPRATIRTDDD